MWRKKCLCETDQRFFLQVCWRRVTGDAGVLFFKSSSREIHQVTVLISASSQNKSHHGGYNAETELILTN